MIEYAQQKLKDRKYLTEELMYEACKDGKTLSMETKRRFQFVHGNGNINERN